MNPTSGIGAQRSANVDFGAVAQDIKQNVFSVAKDVAAFFQSAASEIGTKIQGLDAPPATPASFAAAPATTTAPLIQSQQAMAPQNLRDYGAPHPMVKFAAGIDSTAKHFEVTDIGLPNGTATKWNEGKDEKLLRPDPSTYLDPGYMNSHLAMFDEGAISFITPWAFEKFTVDGNQSQYHGRAEGLFVLPAKWAKEVIGQGLSDASITNLPAGPEQSRKLVEFVERRMGIPVGCWSAKSTKLLAVFIDKPRDLNLRFVTGREEGANAEWRPGGYTLGGVPEAMIDKAGLEDGLAIPFNALFEVLTDRALRPGGEI